MINWRELQVHPLNQFPAMQDWEFSELKESISKGYDDEFPIIVYKGSEDSGHGIIDGANRHRACLETGTIPLIKEFYGTYEQAMVKILGTNIRRNLSQSQKATVVLDMDGIVSKLVEDGAKRVNQHSGGETGFPGKTADKLAEMSGTSNMTIKQAKKVKQHDPALYEHVKSGNISAKSAFNQIQDRIAQGDESLRKQRLAKSILKNAIQDAINESKDELFAEALRRVESTEKNQIDFKLKLTLS